MKDQRDKHVIEHWLQLYNRLVGASYRVETWPDDDSSKKNIDAMCRDSHGHTLAIEHTLIEPVAGEKGDADRFMRTLGPLEDHPSLVQPGYMLVASQAVGSVPSGINWDDIRRELLNHLPNVLRALPEGRSQIAVRVGKCELSLRIQKQRLRVGAQGKFFTARGFQGDPGPELIIRALEKKIPKLAASCAEKKLLLLEKDAVAGMIESQFDQIPREHEVRKLLAGIDEIWSVNTSALESENVIFTNRIVPYTVPCLDPATICSLNVISGKFWREPTELVG